MLEKSLTTKHIWYNQFINYTLLHAVWLACEPMISPALTKVLYYDNVVPRTSKVFILGIRSSWVRGWYYYWVIVRKCTFLYSRRSCVMSRQESTSIYLRYSYVELATFICLLERFYFVGDIVKSLLPETLVFFVVKFEMALMNEKSNKKWFNKIYPYIYNMTIDIWFFTMDIQFLYEITVVTLNENMS